MLRFIIVCSVSGIIFGTLDGVIHGNPLAISLFQVYSSLARKEINFRIGILIDLFYGFVLGGLYLLLYSSLPGSLGIMKGLSYAGILWFLRVFMNTVSSWMMYTIPVKTLIYTALSGLVEMAFLGALYGLFLYM